MKYGTPTRMISARISEANLRRLDKMSETLRMSKNEILNEAVLQMAANFNINQLYRQAEAIGDDMDRWSRETLKYHYAGKNLAVIKLHHTW